VSRTVTINSPRNGRSGATPRLGDIADDGGRNPRLVAEEDRSGCYIGIGCEMVNPGRQRTGDSLPVTRVLDELDLLLAHGRADFLRPMTHHDHYRPETGRYRGAHRRADDRDAVEGKKELQAAPMPDGGSSRQHETGDEASVAHARPC
jgi:hypothetical protein